MGVLIDTPVFVTLERRGWPLNDLLVTFPSGDFVGLAAITASELLAGLHLADTDARRLRREAFLGPILDGLFVLAFDLECARKHARVSADLRKKGQRIGPHDLLIAATALTHGHAVLTENVREFERVSGLDVRRPNWS